MSQTLKNFNYSYRTSNWFSRLLFNWSTPLIKHVYKTKHLESPTQWVQMDAKHSTRIMTERVGQQLSRMLEAGHFDYKWSVVKLVFRTWKWELVGIVFLGCIYELIYILNMFLTSFFIDWIKDENANIGFGILYSFLIGLLLTLFILGKQKFLFDSKVIGINMRKGIGGLLMNKSLKLSKRASSVSLAGKIITIVGSELPSIDDGLSMAPYIIITPLNTVFAFIFIAINFKEAAVIGLIVCVVLIFIQALTSKISMKLKYHEGKHSSKRLKMISEAVNNIRTIKAYAWETIYKKLINKWRHQQLSKLFKTQSIFAVGSGIFRNGGVVIAFFVFGYHYLMGREFDYARSLAAFGMMNYLANSAIYNCFVGIYTFASFVAIMFRVGEILEMEEFDEDKAIDDENLPDGVRVKMDNCSLAWNVYKDPSNVGQKNPPAQNMKTDTDIVLKNINLEAKRGQLTAVVGGVGSGKTSLLHAIMHELEILSGTLRTNGSVAYVEQDPFIVTGTVRSNIVMGNIFNQKRFDKVVDVWCLKQDLQSFENGLATELSENGTSLSGGQRARISLARAVYSDADIYLLDDPLSAVDPEVAEELFNKCINGFLKDRCRILNTHQVQYLKDTSSIVYLEEGKIKAHGSFKYLKENGVDLDKNLKSYEYEEIDEGEFVGDKDVNPKVIDDLNIYEITEENLSINDKIDSVEEEKQFQSFSYQSESDFNPRKGRETEPNIDPNVPTLSTKHVILNTVENLIIDDLVKITAKDPIMISRNRPNLIVTFNKTPNKLVITSNKRKGAIKIRDWIQFFSFGYGILGIILMIILWTIVTVFALGANYIIGEWTSEDTKGSDRHSHYSLYFKLFSGWCFFILLFGFIFSLCVATICMKSTENIHSKMIWNVLRSPLNFFDEHPLGHIITRFSFDIMQTEDTLPKQLDSFLNSAFRMIGSVIFICVVVPFNFVSLVIVAIPMYFAKKYQQISQSDCQRIESISRGPINSRYAWVIDGLTTIRVYHKENYFIDWFMIDSDVNAGAKFTLLGVLRWFSTRLDLLSAVFVIATLVMVILMKIFTNFLDLSLAALTIQFAFEFSFNFGYTLKAMGKLENMITSSQRIIDFTNLEQEDALEKPNDNTDWTERPNIEFDDVYMKYRPDLPPVLNGFTHSISEQEKVGIIGRTGAGKSSVFQAMFRLVETNGLSKIYIGGVDIKTIGLHCLRSNISYIPQTPFIMTDTIRSNLDPFCKHSNEAIWSVLEDLKLKDYFLALKNGLDTDISEIKVFSAGQKQLVCLARAILWNNKILIIDEATANLDIETDKFIQEVIRDKFKEWTVLAIAHRLATLKDSDTIVVMEQGRVKETGSPKEILSSSKNIEIINQES